MLLWLLISGTFLTQFLRLRNIIRTRGVLRGLLLSWGTRLDGRFSLLQEGCFSSLACFFHYYHWLRDNKLFDWLHDLLANLGPQLNSPGIQLG